jgi:hypothetical protein
MERDALRRAFPTLFHYLCSYLHQDFDLDYPNADAAIADFVSSNRPDLVALARKELGQFIELVKHADNPSKLLYDLGCEYNPTAEGMSVVEWLQKVERMLASS